MALPSPAEIDAMMAAEGHDITSLPSPAEIDAMMAAENPQGNAFQNASSGVLSSVAGVGDIADLISSYITPSGIMQKSGINAALGLSQPESYGEGIRSAFNTVTGNPQSTELGKGTYARKFGEYLPFMANPASLLKSAAQTGITSAEGYLGDKYGGPLGELGAVLVGSAAQSKVKDLFSNLFTQTGKEQAAKIAAQKILNENITKPPEEITRSIDDALSNSNPFAQYKRTAELTQDPGIASLENALARTDIGTKAAIESQNAIRESAREGMLKDIIPIEATPEEVGNIVRSGLESGAKEQKGIVDFYGNAMRSGDGSIQTFPAKAAVSDVLYDFTKSGARSVSKDFEGLVDNFRNLPAQVDIGTLQDYRSAFGKYAGGGGLGSSTVDKMTAQIASTVRDTIDNQIAKAVSANQLPKDQALDLSRMIEERKRLGSIFESGQVGKVLQKEPFNTGFKIESSQVGKALIKTPEDARQAIEALRGKSESVDALRTSLLDHIWESSTNPMTKEFNATAFNKQLRTLGDVSKEILEPSQIEALSLIGNDLASQSSIGKLAYSASKGQSSTTETRTAIETLQHAIQEKSSTMLSKIPYIGKLADALFSHVADPAKRQILINNQLAKAALDPAYAKEMLGPIKNASSVLSTITNNLIPALGVTVKENVATKSSPNADLFKSVFTKGSNSMAQPISAIESEIDSDPYYSAVYETESGRNPQASNPNSSAKGAFQLINATAKNLGVEDPLDLEQNFEGFKKLTEENKARFGNDPITLYKAHYLGAPLLKKVQQGKALTPQEQAIVRDLQARALPRFLKIYTRITGGEEV